MDPASAPGLPLAAVFASAPVLPSACGFAIFLERTISKTFVSPPTSDARTAASISGTVSGIISGTVSGALFISGTISFMPWNRTLFISPVSPKNTSVSSTSPASTPRSSSSSSSTSNTSIRPVSGSSIGAIIERVISSSCTLPSFSRTSCKPAAISACRFMVLYCPISIIGT